MVPSAEVCDTDLSNLRPVYDQMGNYQLHASYKVDTNGGYNLVSPLPERLQGMDYRK